MAVLKASRLKAVLDKARNAGQVEESATIAGLALVFQSLRAEAYNAILREIADAPETSYATLYQIEHVCRSIVEIDGQDLREVDYVETESEGANTPIKVERHQWVKDVLVSTWSREMVQIAFRKVIDAITGAELKAAEGVRFRVEAESDEEKYRRLLTEAKEVASDVPDDMRVAILKEQGLLEATTKAEIEDLDARARTWNSTEPEPAPDTPPESPTAEAPSAAPMPPRAPVQIVQAATSDFAEAATEPPPSPAELMARRTPLNRTAVQEPLAQSRMEATPQVANRRSPPPKGDQVHSISSRYANIEGLANDQEHETQHITGQAPHEGNAPVILEHRAVPIDKEGVKAIVDKPPVVGRNVKFSPRSGAGLDPRNRG